MNRPSPYSYLPFQMKADWKSILVDAPDFDRALQEVGSERVQLD